MMQHDAQTLPADVSEEDLASAHGGDEDTGRFEGLDDLENKVKTSAQEPKGTHQQDEGKPSDDQESSSLDEEGAPHSSSETTTLLTPEDLHMQPRPDGSFSSEQVGMMLQSVVGLLSKQQREIAEMRKSLDDAISSALSNDTRMDGILALLAEAASLAKERQDDRTDPKAGG